MKDHADTIAHECGHAIGLLVEGHRVGVVRVDHERLGELGRVSVDYSESSADYGMLVAGLMGPLAAGDAPPSWPLDPDSADTDERNIARLCEHLGIEHEGSYMTACLFAATWLDWHEVKGASALLSQALHRVPVISGDQLEELLGPRLARLRHEPRPEGEHDSAPSQAG